MFAQFSLGLMILFGISGELEGLVDEAHEKSGNKTEILNIMLNCFIDRE